MKQKSAGAIIFRKDENKVFYLLLKYEKGHWGFAKGHIEKNETEEETIIRETKEEADITQLNLIKGFKEYISYYFVYETKKIYKEVVFYLAETKQKEVRLSFSIFRQSLDLRLELLIFKHKIDHITTIIRNAVRDSF